MPHREPSLKFTHGRLRGNLAAQLVKSLRENPGEWSWGDRDHESYITHATGVSVWVNYNIRLYHPQKVEFSFWQRRRLKRALRAWRKSHGSIQKLRKEEETMREAMRLLRGEPKLKAVA